MSKSNEYSDPFATQQSRAEQPRSFLNFVQWLHNVGSNVAQTIKHLYHAEVRLQGANREGVLIDTGAADNISGINFVKRVEAISRRFGGQVTVTPLKENIGIPGIGKKSDECTHEATIPVCLPDGRVGRFKTPIISNPDIPAIWGLQSMSSQRVLIDTRNKIMICVGSKGYKLDASAGSVTYKLETSRTGHLFLPITEWQNHEQNIRKTRAQPVNSVSL